MAPLDMTEPCKLPTTSSFRRVYVGDPVLTHQTSLGLTVFASQVYSIKDHLPAIPAWTYRDCDGIIGIAMGHRGSGTSYIQDMGQAKELGARVNTGPYALIHDRCSGAYDRAYVRCLGIGKPVRPSCQGPILCISYNPSEVKGELSETDWLLSKRPNGGRFFPCLPRRHVRDGWYLVRFERAFIQ